LLGHDSAVSNAAPFGRARRASTSLSRLAGLDGQARSPVGVCELVRAWPRHRSKGAWLHGGRRGQFIFIFHDSRAPVPSPSEPQCCSPVVGEPPMAFSPFHHLPPLHIPRRSTPTPRSQPCRRNTTTPRNTRCLHSQPPARPSGLRTRERAGYIQPRRVPQRQRPLGLGEAVQMG
jgi:hypothetical protein